MTHTHKPAILVIIALAILGLMAACTPPANALDPVVLPSGDYAATLTGLTSNGEPLDAPLLIYVDMHVIYTPLTDTTAIAVHERNYTGSATIRDTLDPDSAGITLHANVTGSSDYDNGNTVLVLEVQDAVQHGTFTITIDKHGNATWTASDTGTGNVVSGTAEIFN